MRRDVHREALKVAVRLALCVGVVEGCRTAPDPDASIHADDVVASPTPEPSDVAAPAPEGALVTDCRAVVIAAFPVASEYPGVRRDVGDDVRTCCGHLLEHQDTIDLRRWDCCANSEPENAAQGCSPWGPPMPPAIARDHAPRIRGTLDLRARARAVRPTVPRVPALRDAAIATWRARMANEYGSADVFAALAEQLARAGLHDLVDEVRGFADEEHRHGVLCGAVVEALGADATADAIAQDSMPTHDDVSPLEGVLRNVISICCLSETVAVALIGAERFAMPPGELRSLLTQIWADEIGHARFGWRLLARLAPMLDDAARERLGDWLEIAFAHLETHELAHLPLASQPPAEGVVYGLCNGADARRLFRDTVAQAIVPGLAAHGLPAARAWRNRPAEPFARIAGT